MVYSTNTILAQSDKWSILRKTQLLLMPVHLLHVTSKIALEAERHVLCVQL